METRVIMGDLCHDAETLSQTHPSPTQVSLEGASCGELFLGIGELLHHRFAGAAAV